MNLKIRYNKKELVYIIVVAFLLFYSYQTTFQNYLYGSRSNGIIVVFVVCGIGIIHQINKISFKPKESIYWYLLAFLSIFNNQDMLLDTQSRWLLPMAGISTIFILKNSTCWHNMFLWMSRTMVLVHAFFTIFFSIFKSLYTNYFFNIIPGASSSLLNKFNAGCMPGITAHYSTNGIYLGFGLVFFMTDIITRKSQTQNGKNKDYLKLFFVLVALVLTAKRAHFLVAIVAGVAMFFVYNSNKKMSRWIYILLGGIVGGVVFFTLAQFVPALANVVNRFVNPDGGDMTNGRIWFWKHAINCFKQNPITGIGWGGFKHTYYDIIGNYSSNSQYVEAHNVYLQILCEQGIVGLLLFVFAVFATFIQCWKLLKEMRTKIVKDINKQQYLLTLSLGIQTFFIFYCFTGNCLYDCEAFYVYILSCVLFYSLKLEMKGVC